MPDRTAPAAVPPAVPQGPSRDPPRIARMFDAIAARYDLLNHVLSAGFDRRWRRRAVAELRLSGTERLVDLCTGTADLAIAAVRARRGAAAVVGLDFSAEMLRIGREKLRRASLSPAVRLVRADACRVPLGEGTFDAATIAFGIRNVEEPRLALAEIARVLRGGGRLAILEFGVPRVAGVRALYLWYFRRVLPWIGRLISRHDEAYSYLPASVGVFPSPDTFARLLRETGFDAVRAVSLSAGIVYLYVAEKRA